MKRILVLLLSLFSVALVTHRALAQTGKEEKSWRVVLARDVYIDYQHFIGSRDPLTLKHFGGPYSRRDVVEVVLLQQALQRGGVGRRLHFILSDSEGRTLKTLASGGADVSASSSWKSSTTGQEKKLLVSRALIAQGRFMAGLYFPEHHHALKNLAAYPENIRRYTAVCVESWTPDIVTLKKLGSPVLLTENWESMLGMLKKQRGDFLLAPFQPTPGLRLQAGGMTLVPVPGIKVGLAGSRHFILWRQGKEAKTLRDALDRGLQQLEAEGTLARAYRESGFENAESQNWRLLNP
jgi:hypothetical protein